MSSHLEPAWQGKYAQRWLRWEAQKNKQLGPLGDLALSALTPRTGEWILDVGCGAGATTLELGRKTGPRGGAWGIDISTPMLEGADHALEQARVSNVSFVQGDASTYQFPRTFDALFSRFGVMFFDDPAAAFENLREALVDKGRLAFVCWQSISHNPWAKVPLEALRAADPSLVLPEMFLPDQPGPFALADGVMIASLLSQAGFSSIEVRPERRRVPLGASLEEAIGYCMDTGPSGRMLSEAEAYDEALCRRALHDALSPFTSSLGVLLDAAVNVVIARSN